MKKHKRLSIILLALLFAFMMACTPSDATDITPTPNISAPTPEPPQIEDLYDSEEALIQGGSILHAWCWSFNTIAENMKDIADAGFSAVQTSPISECIPRSQWAPGASEGMQIFGDGAWWYHYQPISYRIGNYQLGTEEEFAEMCRVAKEHGVKVIVDAVVNHFSSDFSQIRDEIKDIEGGGLRPGMSASGDRKAQTQGQLLSLYDANTHNPNVQKEVQKYLRRCVELGASGFRYDAAFHIELPTEDEPELSSDFWLVALDNGAEFQYGELLGSAEAEVYSEYMNVTDAIYGRDIVSALRDGRLSASALKGYRLNIEPRKMITWVESHDTYCNEGETSDLTPQQVLFGWAVLSARDGSTPLYFNRPDGSTPGTATRWGNNIVGAKGNDEFKSKEVAALNRFKRAMHGTEEFFSNLVSDESILMIERGSGGAVIINMGGEVTLKNAAANLLADGTYTCLVSGNEFTVSDGKISGKINAESVTVFYKESYPSVFLTPGGGDFYNDTLELSLFAANTANAYYSINGGDEVSYSSGQKITIGAGAGFDESVVVTLRGDSDLLPITRDYTFTKRQPQVVDGDTVVYFANNDGWEQVYCYIYAPSFGGVTENNSWPGIPMTHIEGSLYSYEIPDTFTDDMDIHVMFNNDAGEQIPPPQAPGLIIKKGQHMILEGTRLVPYE